MSARMQAFIQLANDLAVGGLEQQRLGCGRLAAFGQAHLAQEQLDRAGVAGGRPIDQLFEYRFTFFDAFAPAVFIYYDRFIKRLFQQGG
jgi:hypothetical protein